VGWDVDKADGMESAGYMSFDGGFGTNLCYTAIDVSATAAPTLGGGCVFTTTGAAALIYVAFAATFSLLF